MGLLATPTQVLAAASTAIVGVLDRPARIGRVVAVLPVAVHIATGDPDLPLVCVATADAVRLPCSLVVRALPPVAVDDRVELGGGRIVVGDVEVRPSRWWQPSKPRLRDVDEARRRLKMVAPDIEDLREWTSGRAEPGPMSTDGDLAGEPVRAVLAGGAPLAELVPELLGLGPGLTPAGDDVLAGALVAAQATDDPRLPDWRASVLQLLRRRPTTAVSEAMLRCALDGFATPQLADYVHAVCTAGTHTDPDVLDAATVNLLAVGSSSGAALMAGVLHTLTTAGMREAA